MGAKTPEACHQLLAAAISNRDIDAVMGLFHPDAELILQDGKEYIGKQKILAVQKKLIDLSPKLIIDTLTTTQVGNVALLTSQWQVTGFTEDKLPVQMTHKGIDVVQQQANGEWLYIISRPFMTD